MTRKDELTALVPEDSRELTADVIEEIVFLESKLKELKRLPFIKVNPQNTDQQKSTPAAKMYKEFLQQYINCVKVIESVIYRDKKLDGDQIEDSPLRAWFKSHDS